jgi:hypothetical protein
MKPRYIPIAAVALLLGANVDLRAQTPPAPPRPCIAPFGWFESNNLAPIFPSTPNPTDCNFQVWSWTAFVHWMMNDPATSQPLFLSLPTPDDLKSGDLARAQVGPRALTLKPRGQKPRTAIGEIEQAGTGGVLVDQTGRAVYYSTHMDPIYFRFTQQYYGPNYANATPTVQYPLNATVFKAAWRIVPSGQTVTDAYTTTATIALLESDGQGGLKTSGQTATATVALIGVHVVGVVQGHPEFLWATFEQVNNAPDLPAGMSPSSPNPVSAQNFTFYKGGTPANASNVQASAFTINPTTQVISPITNVFRQFAYGGATPALRVYDITTSNQFFQNQLTTGASKLVSPVFGNYKLIGTVWILTGTLQPGDGNMNAESIGSINLMSSVLETFAQNFSSPGSPGNCFLCHNTSGGSNYPGKDINLSHILLDSIPQNPAIRSAR